MRDERLERRHGEWPRWPPDDERTRQALAVSTLAGRWAISGPPSPLPSYLDAAASRVAALAGRRFAVLTSSGSSAIVLALQALGIGPGSRVLVPATTWVACATAVLRTGATPVFCDAGRDTPCADNFVLALPNREVDAVLAVHLYASQVDVAALRASLPGVPIVEDGSHCHGAVTPDGRPLGSLGDVAVFSFQATKILPAGEGGAVVTDDETIAARVQSLATDSRRVVACPPHDALSRLEPAGLLHGANHAMSEFSGAVLWSQLLRLRECSDRRAAGLRRFAELLAPVAGVLAFDLASARSGGFYGVPFLLTRRWARGAEEAIEEVRSACGARLDRVYPPIPDSPLYRPWTVPGYRRQPEDVVTNLPHSGRWHRDGVVIPHPVFLAGERHLTALAEALTQLPRPRPRRSPPPCPDRHGDEDREVCVVVLTTGARDTLIDALRSLARQTFRGQVTVLLVCDGQHESVARVPNLLATAQLPPELELRTITVDLARNEPQDLWGTFARVASLRNVALDQATAPLLAFLDDDNAWEPQHLSALARLAARTRALAVHSWRRLVAAGGEPCVPDTFPWLPDPVTAASRFALLTAAGVFRPGSDLVRDCASIPAATGHGTTDHGMVDLGEWLFDRRLFDVVRFETRWTTDEVTARVGEDDKLLRRLRELLIPVHCTREASLRYRLGGFTNTFTTREKPASLPLPV